MQLCFNQIQITKPFKSSNLFHQKINPLHTSPKKTPVDAVKQLSYSNNDANPHHTPANQLQFSAHQRRIIRPFVLPEQTTGKRIQFGFLDTTRSAKEARREVRNACLFLEEQNAVRRSTYTVYIFFLLRDLPR